MNTEDLELSSLLRQNRPVPPLPPRFQPSVWRRIEDAETAAGTTWLDALAALMLRPRFALAAAAVLVLTGVLAGALEGRHHALQDAQMNYFVSVSPSATP